MLGLPRGTETSELQSRDTFTKTSEKKTMPGVGAMMKVMVGAVVGGLGSRVSCTSSHSVTILTKEDVY